MSESAIDGWRDLAERMNRFAGYLSRTKSVNVNSKALKEEAFQIAQIYFREVRPLLVQGGVSEIIEPFDSSFQRLVEMTQSQVATSSYKRVTSQIRALAPKVTAQLAVRAGVAQPDANGPASEDLRIIETLSQLLPSAAASYKQALVDISDANRASYRGPALELRECLRETLDHLAPDDDVMREEGFKLEKDRPKPTMKQKVRFILKARGRNKTEMAVPSDSAMAIDGMVGDLARSVYNNSSLATHVATSRKNVTQIKIYVGAVLHDILEL